uniref:Uncharacterized protein n=1 Tax=Cacopsylla melanoneura TaxID=428564 RepID=A0A8D9EUG8_9HEMI
MDAPASPSPHPLTVLNPHRLAPTTALSPLYARRTDSRMKSILTALRLLFCRDLTEWRTPRRAILPLSSRKNQIIQLFHNLLIPNFTREKSKSLSIRPNLTKQTARLTSLIKETKKPLMRQTVLIQNLTKQTKTQPKLVNRSTGHLLEQMSVLTGRAILKTCRSTEPRLTEPRLNPRLTVHSQLLY